MAYTHLTETERYQIYTLKKTGHTQKYIAEFLKRSAATISRELNRNRGGCGYRPQQAQRMSVERRAINARKIDPVIWGLRGKVSFATMESRTNQWNC